MMRAITWYGITRKSSEISIGPHPASLYCNVGIENSPDAASVSDIIRFFKKQRFFIKNVTKLYGKLCISFLLWGRRLFNTFHTIKPLSIEPVWSWLMMPNTLPLGVDISFNSTFCMNWRSVDLCWKRHYFFIVYMYLSSVPHKIVIFFSN